MCVPGNHVGVSIESHGSLSTTADWSRGPSFLFIGETLSPAMTKTFGIGLDLFVASRLLLIEQPHVKSHEILSWGGECVKVAFGVRRDFPDIGYSFFRSFTASAWSSLVGGVRECRDKGQHFAPRSSRAASTIAISHCECVPTNGVEPCWVHRCAVEVQELGMVSRQVRAVRERSTSVLSFLMVCLALSMESRSICIIKFFFCDGGKTHVAWTFKVLSRIAQTSSSLILLSTVVYLS